MWSKNKGGPAPPESATVEEKEIRGGGVWADLELIELEHFCLKLGPGHKNAIKFDHL